ncbi:MULTISPECIES: regulatory protein RecX [unclassified Marinobacterium]|jgi:regulatory protein|uniref:regulatory protein RecX n=1 Tax=unclassified Marinobacterium TaxID=2644139 RepID=UPI001568030A|nr:MULTISPECIES: regulatory protein RecX [unclassified Marinobacterium]NRP37255.1 Regulatory protein RecX [Marinobacterium sp. xm-d-579]NRP38151.1 Regulatory protein RecX [Marinobacterium sp. xm-a-121]NRP53072.1 Regulatory protein RecX [Marinobacterium sp. xm-v-242]NRP57577.1 Regulatory protein RecX [Marinobacterium sp. xm-d-510]NRP59602.1 Regulatory protein RecX [Marinobacterium sp. xm-d-564]
MQKRQKRPIETESELRSFAFSYLARQEYSQSQLRERLAKRCEKPELIERVLTYLVEEGYQSDSRFAESYIRVKSDQGQGGKKIAFDLSRKGISKQLIEELLDSRKDDPKQVALEYLKRKFGEEPPEDMKVKAKWFRHMAGRGFNYGEIEYAFRYQNSDPDYD